MFATFLIFGYTHAINLRLENEAFTDLAFSVDFTKKIAWFAFFLEIILPKIEISGELVFRASNRAYIARLENGM